LHAEEIGVSLTEEHQIDPEQSTSAIVVTHPQGETFLGVRPPARRVSRRWMPKSAL
jgi:hypothetical protein